MNTRTLKVGVLAALSLVVATVAMAHTPRPATTEPFNPDKFWTDKKLNGS